MRAEWKNGGETPVDRSNLLKFEDGEMDKDEETGLQRSTLGKGEKREISPTPLALLLTRNFLRSTGKNGQKTNTSGSTEQGNEMLWGIAA